MIKRLISALIICSFVFVPANAATIPTDTDVPYTVDLDFLYQQNVSAYNIHNLRELRRLLDFVKQTRTDNIDIKLCGSATAADVENEIESFYRTNIDLFAHLDDYPPLMQGIMSNVEPYEITDYSEGISIVFQWLTWELDDTAPLGMKTIWEKYDSITELTTVEEFYNAALDGKYTKNYVGTYKLSEELLAIDEYRSTNLQTLYDAVQSTYGEDVSGYINGHFADSETSDILIEVAYYTDQDLGDLKTQKDKERFDRILKNNVVWPITDDMSDLDKLRVITNSASNSFRHYNITDLPRGSELAYSVGVGQCAHYADAVARLCTLYGLEARFISGTNSGSEHAWNAVMCDGNWYLVDTTGHKVLGHDIRFEHLGIYLKNDDYYKKYGYAWNSADAPVCNSEAIDIDPDYSSYVPELTETTERYALIEPYQSKDPMTTGAIIYYEVLFDKANGKIVAIDTNMMNDTTDEVDGEWVKKEVVLEIPSEIDGVKVQSIGKLYDSISQIVHVDKLIIPDGITIDDWAFDKGFVQEIADEIIIGDNVTLGHTALPEYDKITVGENFNRKGTFRFGGSYDQDKKTIDLATDDTLSTAYLSYSSAEVLQAPEGYSFALYGTGNNIVDRAPVKTLEIPAGYTYIDPQLGRLNRLYEVSEDNPNYTSKDGILYNKDMTTLISVPIGVGSIEIPDTVTEIGEYAFCYCNEIEEITIPDSVQSIGYRAFWHISNLKKLYFEGDIPENYTATLCSDFDIIELKNSSVGRLSYTNSGVTITMNNAPSGGTPFVAYYDYLGNLMEIKEGSVTDIPLYAKSYKLYVWDEQLRPMVYTEEGEF